MPPCFKLLGSFGSIAMRKTSWNLAEKENEVISPCPCPLLYFVKRVRPQARVIAPMAFVIRFRKHPSRGLYAGKQRKVSSRVPPSFVKRAFGECWFNSWFAFFIHTDRTDKKTGRHYIHPQRYKIIIRIGKNSMNFTTFTKHPPTIAL